MQIYKIKIAGKWFLLFPRKFPPFYLVDFSLFFNVRSCLNFYMAGGWRETLVKSAVPLIIFAGGKGGIFRETALENAKDIEMVYLIIKEKFPCEAINFYIHSLDRYVVQCIGGQRISLYIKIEKGSNTSNNSLLKEREIIDFLNSRKPVTFLVPSGEYSEKEGFAFLSLTTFERLKRVRNELNEGLVKLSSEIFKLSENGLIHGDFKPWNIYWVPSEKKYFVIDWEDAEFQKLPLYDLFNFRLLTLASTKIGISGMRLLEVLKKDLSFYRMFLNLTDYPDTTEEVMKWLRVYLKNIVNKRGFWSRWDEREKRPAMIRQSLVELYKIVGSGE